MFHKIAIMLAIAMLFLLPSAASSDDLNESLIWKSESFGSAYDMVVSPDGTKLLLYSGDNGKELKLFNIEDGELLFTQTTISSPGKSLFYHPGGENIVVKHPNSIMVLSAADLTIKKTIDFNSEIIYVCFAEYGSKMYVSARDKGLHVFDTEEWELESTIMQYYSYGSDQLPWHFWEIDFTENGRFMAARVKKEEGHNASNYLRIYDLQESKEVILEKLDGYKNKVKIAPDGKDVFVELNRSIEQYDMETGEQEREYNINESINDFDISWDSRYLLVASEQEVMVEVWDYKEKKWLYDYVGNTNMHPVVVTSSRGNNYVCFLEIMGGVYVLGSREMETSVEEIEYDDCMVFPNPCDGVAKLRIESENGGMAEMILVDQLGVERMTKKVEISRGENLISLNLSDVATGLYFLRIERNGSIETIPILKE
jgi:WD40 repeat protein